MGAKELWFLQKMNILIVKVLQLILDKVFVIFL